MKTVRRVLEAELVRAASAFSVILLTGPRRSGKTTLLRHAFPKADYRLLEANQAFYRMLVTARLNWP